MRHIILLLTVVLAGCATPAAQSTMPLSVSADDHARYWQPTGKSFRPDIAPAAPGKQYASKVEVEYTIDTQGRVRDARVVSFEPQGADPAWGLAAIEASRFVPGPDNAERRSIRARSPVQLEGND